MIVNCKNCGVEINRRPVNLKRSKSGNLYCSKSCAVSNNNKIHRQGENHPNYRTGIGSYRNRKLKESLGICENCSIDDKRVLQVHHIDGNRKNNKLENLKLVCANCHLIEHYRDVEKSGYSH